MSNIMKLLEALIIMYILTQINTKNVTKITRMALKQGYNITNPNDRFFNDICFSFTSEKGKDVSLQYRRKYYYFLNDGKESLDDKDLKTIFKQPLRNSFYKCLFNKKKIKFTSMYLSLIIFLPLFFLQQALLAINVFTGYTISLKYTPIQKNRLISKKNNNQINKNINNNDVSSGKSEREKLPPNKEEKPKEENFNIQKDFNFKKCDFPSFGPNFSCKIDIKEENNEIPTTGEKKSNDVQKQNDKENSNSNKINSEENHITNDISGYIYDKINVNRFKRLVMINDKPSENIYVNEEYFYFQFDDACVIDNRNIYQIYKDLLEQCQIFFKLISIMNIYEDKSNIIVYYCFKIYLHFLSHLILFKMSDINDIYNNNLNYFNIMLRCLFSTLIVGIISVMFDSFTNIKQSAIKVRKKIMELRLHDEKLIRGILILKNKILVGIMFFKMIGLYIICIVFFAISFGVYFNFCNVFPNTKWVIFYEVIVNMMIAQIAPFILCWIPSYLRYKAIEKKSKKLYNLCSLVESLFIP